MVQPAEAMPDECDFRSAEEVVSQSSKEKHRSILDRMFVLTRLCGFTRSKARRVIEKEE